jgi:hypothetical protein
VTKRFEVSGAFRMKLAGYDAPPPTFSSSRTSLRETPWNLLVSLLVSLRGRYGSLKKFAEEQHNQLLHEDSRYVRSRKLIF